MIFLKILWFFLPAYAANMAASLFRIKFLDKPVSEKYLGSNKTYRGFFFGVLTAIIVSLIQRLFFNFSFFQKISYLDYAKNFLLIGFLLGFGALAGDAVESFFKRRWGISPGAKWFPFDQIDYTLGALLFVSFIWQPSLSFILISIVFNLLGHIFINHLSFWLGIRRNKW